MSYLTAKQYNINFTKSLADRNKSFRLVQLSNGLLALLVSDPAIEVAAGAVCVATGSHNDPDHIPGLAHLCEHMLFLGTKQFPGANQFFDLLNANGGTANAFTTGEQTCFHFALKVNENTYHDEPLFNYALRNFASFFKSPLFNEKDIKNEVMVVDDEHRSNLCDPGKLLYHGLRLSSNNRHPFHRFATGTAQTILGRLRNELQKYFETYYSTENMTLVIKGPQSLNHLQKLAILSFSDIKPTTEKYIPSTRKVSRYSQEFVGRVSRNSRDSSLRASSNSIFSTLSIPHYSILQSSYNYQCPVFSKENLNKLTFIHYTNQNIIRLYYPIYSYHEIDKIDFLEHVWCNIIGDESPNTLCSFLRERGYIESLLVHVQTLSINDKLLCIDIELSSKGSWQVSEVVETVLKFILDLCNGKIEGFPEYLSQLLTIAKLNYYYQDSHRSCMEEVALLSQFLQLDLERLGAENLVKGHRDLDYDDKFYGGDYSNETRQYWQEISNLVISMSTEILSMGNLGILFMGDKKDLLKDFLAKYGSHPSNIVENIDSYYNFKYEILPFDSIKLYIPISSLTCLNFAAKNSFLSHTQVELNEIAQSSEVSNYRTRNFSHNVCPKLLDYSENYELWFKQENDANFESKVLVSIQVQSLEIENNARHSVVFEMICIVLGNLLRSTSYGRELVGFSWGIRCNLTGAPGLSFTVSGIAHDFHRMLGLFIDEISTFFTEGNINYRTFMKARVQLRKQYLQLKNSNGIKQAIAGSLLMLEEGIWSLDERIEELEMLELEDLTKFARKLTMDQKYARVLINGNMTYEMASNLSNIVEKVTDHKKIHLKGKKLIEPSSYLLKKDYTLTVANFNKEDQLNTVYFYVQTGLRGDLKARSMTLLISYAISLHASYELRTKRQLAYTVMCGPRFSRETTGIYVCVMSNTNKAVDILLEINELMKELAHIWSSYNHKQFYSEIIHGFLHKDEENELPQNISFGLQPDESSSNFNIESTTYTIHNKLWEKIISRRYRFDDDEELEYIKQLSRESFLEYFKSHFLQSERASLSILINTAMTRAEIEAQKTAFQLQSYLQCRGVTVNISDIIQVLKRDDLITAANHFLKINSRNLLLVDKYTIKKWTKSNHIQRPKYFHDSIMLHNPHEIHKYCKTVPRSNDGSKLAYFENSEEDLDLDYDWSDTEEVGFEG